MPEYISESLSMQLGAEFTLLRTPLFAGVKKKGEDGYELLVTPTDALAGPGMTIREMVADVNKLMGKADALNAEQVECQLSTLNPNSGVDFTQIRIALTQAFVHYTSSDSAVEYAICIVVDAHELLPADMGLVNINRLTLAVWNTTRPAVLERMGLGGNTSLLGA